MMAAMFYYIVLAGSAAVGAMLILAETLFYEIIA